MHFYVGKYEFRIGLISLIIGLAGFSLLAGLGFWQLDRAAQKQASIETDAEMATAAVLELSGITDDVAPWLLRHVQASGQYVQSQQYLLDNRTHNGHAGYQVLSVLQLDSGEYVLVNRGWIPLGKSRAELPVVDLPAGKVSLQGQLREQPESFLLSDVVETGVGPVKVIQAVDLNSLSVQLQKTLLPAVLMLSPDSDHGYVRDWKPVYGIGPQEHQAYAFQWFSIAVIMVIIFLSLHGRERENK